MFASAVELVMLSRKLIDNYGPKVGLSISELPNESMG
jgi:hypothetical protein